MFADSKEKARELVAAWDVTLCGKVHKIEFEHGTTSGRRVLWIDNKEVLRRDWMFKLVGDEGFNIGKTKCAIKVDPLPGFRYSYTLYVNGKSFKKFSENQSKVLKTWIVKVADESYRIVLEKDTLNIWINGKIIDETGEFIDGGTETCFTVGGQNVVLTSKTSGNRREGIVYSLFVNGGLISEYVPAEQESEPNEEIVTD